MNETADGALIVFAREPRAGAVKTRLAVKLGAVAAAEIYAELLSRALRIAEGSRFTDLYLYAADRAAVNYFAGRLDRARWRVRTQCKGDIGQRMCHAFEEVLGAHEFAVLIGSDIADCTVADLDSAWVTLSAAPASVIIGPSVDGGYWLIGLSHAHQSIFDDIPWSTPGVLAMTQARSKMIGLNVVSLVERHDVDELDDLKFLACSPGVLA